MPVFVYEKSSLCGFAVLAIEKSFSIASRVSPEKKERKKMPCPEKGKNKLKRRFSYEISVIDVKEDLRSRKFLIPFCGKKKKTLTVIFINIFLMFLQHKNTRHLWNQSCSHVDARAVTN